MEAERPNTIALKSPRAELVILGIVALCAWVGLLAGPALAVIASVLPVQTVRQSSGKA